MYILSIHLHFFKHQVYVFASASTPCPALVGAVFSSGSSVSTIKARCCPSPLVQPMSRVCGAPRTGKSCLPWVGCWVRINTCACGFVCSKHKHAEESPWCASVALQALFPYSLSGILQLRCDQEFVLTIRHKAVFYQIHAKVL